MFQIVVLVESHCTCEESMSEASVLVRISVLLKYKLIQAGELVLLRPPRAGNDEARAGITDSRFK